MSASFCLRIALIFLLVSGFRSSRGKDLETVPGVRDLSHASFEDILRYYQFVGDFTQHPPERQMSDEFFWRYPFPLPIARFKIHHDMGDSAAELPPVTGVSRAVQHMNYGRVLFKKKNFEEARKVWLSARSRYGYNYPWHRRNDYFVSLAYLKISQGILKQFSFNIESSEVRLTYSNTATFLSWAFIKKAHLKDEALDALAPKALYNLSAIYFNFDRYNGAHGAAETGLNFLRRTGRKEFRPEFRRVIAETWIRDHQYLKAVQELDTMIRQDPDPGMAARAFARAGDIYFDLNNYELAEEAYRISQAVDFRINRLLPLSFLLRGESLFWMGKFSEAQKAIRFSLDSISHKNATAKMSVLFRSWGALRMGDAWLARFRKALNLGDKVEARKLRNKAELGYFRVAHEFPGTEAARIASVRLSCLNLPVYLGQNVRHGREVLNSTFNSAISASVQELAGSCEVLSYGRREKDAEFVEKVKVFYNRFPRSKFLKKFIKPLVEVRQNHLQEYLKSGEDHKAALYFEANRKKLFKKPDEETMQQLFLVYMRLKLAKKAAEFYPSFQRKKTLSHLEKIYEMVFLSEFSSLTGRNPAPGRQKELSQYFSDSKTGLDKGSGLTNLFHRILQTPSAFIHLEWILAYSIRGSDDSARFVCDTIYPLLSRKFRVADSPDKRESLWKVVSSFTTKLFPSLFNQSLTCSQALLDLEREIGSKAPFIKEYCERWLSRLDWPHKKIIIPLIWLAAESGSRFREAKSLSDKLLIFLNSQNSGEFPEAMFARSRLDREKTEVEKLWNPDLK